MADQFKIRDPNSEIEILKNTDNYFSELTRDINSKLGVLNLRLSVLENCICPCSVTRWDTPSAGNIAVGFQIVEFQNEVIKGKSVVSNSTIGIRYTANNDGTRSVGCYLRYILTAGLTSDIQLALYKNGMVYSELDYISLSNETEFNIGGMDGVAMKRGNYIDIRINPVSVAVQNIIAVYGYLFINYECSESVEENDPQPILVL